MLATVWATNFDIVIGAKIKVLAQIPEPVKDAVMEEFTRLHPALHLEHDLMLADTARDEMADPATVKNVMRGWAEEACKSLAIPMRYCDSLKEAVAQAATIAFDNNAVSLINGSKGNGRQPK